MAPPTARYLYDLSDSLPTKIQKIATKTYGAKEVVFTAAAQKDLDTLTKQGFGELPVCMAKTHLSLTDEPTRFGRPRDVSVTVRQVRLRAGAGYVVPLTARHHDHARPTQRAGRAPRGGPSRRPHHRPHAGRVASGSSGRFSVS